VGFRVLKYSSVNCPQAGLSIDRPVRPVRPVRPGGRPEQGGVSRAEGSKDYGWGGGSRSKRGDIWAGGGCEVVWVAKIVCFAVRTRVPLLQLHRSPPIHVQTGSE